MLHSHIAVALHIDSELRNCGASRVLTRFCNAEMGCLFSTIDDEPNKPTPPPPPTESTSPIVEEKVEKPTAVLEESRKSNDGDGLASMRMPTTINSGAGLPPGAQVGFGFRPIDDAPAAPAKPSPPVAAPAKKSAKAPKKAAESPKAPARPSAPAAAPAEKKRWGDSDDDDEPPAPPPLRPKKSAKAPKAAPASPPKRKGPSDDDLLAACRSIKDAHPDYGVKRVFKELNARNPAWKVNERKVQKVMRNNGMLVI